MRFTFSKPTRGGDDTRTLFTSFGEIDFGPVFAAIKKIAHDGWISTDEESGAELVGAMEHCFRFMTAGLGESCGNT